MVYLNAIMLRFFLLCCTAEWNEKKDTNYEYNKKLK